jgi:predicted PurR-regulated permease PerM
MSIQRRITLIFFIGILVSFFGIIGWMIAPYLLSLMMAAVLATLINPLYAKLMKRGFSEKVSALVVTIFLLVIVVGPLALFMSNVIRQGTSLAEKLSDQQLLSSQSIASRISQWGLVDNFVTDIESFERQVKTGINRLGGNMTQGFVAVVSNMPDIILQICITLIAFYFFLVDGGDFMKWAGNRVPMDPDIKAELTYSFQNTTVSVIWATLAAAAAQGLLIAAGFMILGIPNAALAAGATFIFAWIPILGSLPVTAAAVIYLYAQDATAKAFVMLGIGIVTGIIDNVVRAWVLNGRDNMHPLVSFVAIFGGIHLFGIFGVFLGPILAAIMIALLNAWPLLARRFGLMEPKEGV